MEKNFFDKGDFLIYDEYGEKFAIWEGEEATLSATHEKAFTLIAYIDPDNCQYIKRKKRYVPDPIFSVGLNGKSCSYAITPDKAARWRKCRQTEINDFLKMLAENGYKWVKDKCEIQKLGPTESLRFDDETISTSSAYSGYSKATVKKRPFDKQVEPIVTMDAESELVLQTACLDYSRKYKPDYPSSWMGQRSYSEYYDEYLYD